MKLVDCRRIRGAPPELLGEIGSWGDGEDDVDVLDGPRLFNRTGSIFTDVDMRADDLE